MDPERRRRTGRWTAALVGLGLLAVASRQGPDFVHTVRAGQRLDEARGAPTLVERRAAYAWLLEHAPDLLIDDLIATSTGRLTTLTGDYPAAVASGAPPRPIRVCPMVEDLHRAGDLDGRLLVAWSRRCEEDGDVALRTAEVVASLLRPQRHDVRACFVRTLCGEPRAGFRRMAYEWLVANEGFPRDHDWRAATSGEVSPFSPRPSPEAAPAEAREEAARRWLQEVERRRQ